MEFSKNQIESLKLLAKVMEEKTKTKKEKIENHFFNIITMMCSDNENNNFSEDKEILSTTIIRNEENETIDQYDYFIKLRNIFNIKCSMDSDNIKYLAYLSDLAKLKDTILSIENQYLFSSLSNNGALLNRP